MTTNIIRFIPRNRLAPPKPGDKVAFNATGGTLRGTVHQIVQRAVEDGNRRKLEEAYIVSVGGNRHVVSQGSIIVPALPEDGVA